MAGKGFDAKAFLVNHTEKLVLGAAGLMVLGFLASSQWKSYPGTPQEIVDKVVKEEKALLGHGWPDSEREKFKLTQANFPKQIVHDNLLSPMSVSQYEMSTRFTITPWQGKEPLREPSLLALEDAIADAGRVLIERPVDPNAATENTETEGSGGAGGRKGPNGEAESAPAMEPEDDEFSSGRGGAAGAAGASGGLPGETAGAITVGGGGLPGASSAPDNYVPPGAGDSGSSGSFLDLYGGATDTGAVAMNREARGYYFASVRAVFPMKEQIRRYQDATNAKTFDMAAMNFDVIDFNLERQEQVDKKGTWSDWQAVDIQAAVDVLDESLPPEPDVVYGSVTNNVMTMPLPPRIMGSWKKFASHPRIDKFELTDEQIQMEIEYQSKILEQLQQSQKETEGKPRREKGGFSSRVGDARAMQADLLGGSAFGTGGYGNGMMGAPGMGAPGMTPPGRGMGSGSSMAGFGAPGMGNPQMGRPTRGPGGAKTEDPLAALLDATEKGNAGDALRDYIKKRVTVDGELLLFRYLDFAVEPGKTYRYRVRLVLNNPNYARLPSEANGEALVVEGETRTTEWCNPTTPVTIERDVYYFVKDVDAKKGKTKVSVYQWDTKFGTTMNADLDLSPGQHIAGTVKTSVADPAKNTVEDKEYAFKSNDVFVDTHPDLVLDRTLHKDLKIPLGSTNEAQIPEEMLVVDSNTGELAVVDSVRLAAEQTRLEGLYKRQTDHFKKLKEAPADAMAMDGYTGMLGDEVGISGAGGRRGKGGRARNPLAGGSGGSSGGSGGRAMPAMRGGGGSSGGSSGSSGGRAMPATRGGGGSSSGSGGGRSMPPGAR